MVRANSHAASFKDLSGQSICVIEGTDNEKQLQARARIQGVALESDAFQEEGEMEDSIVVRRCDGVSAYLSRLGQIRATYPNVLAHDTVLPEMLTLAPVAPAYRQDDVQWGMIVDWTVHALVTAEAASVTQANVATEGESDDIVVQRLLGTDWAASRALGLDDHFWAAKIIAVVGNYGEIYDRTIGVHAALQLPRGLNALWSDGGLIHPLAVQ
jgi:general L-amino acid transport system substrate-binding protein